MACGVLCSDATSAGMETIPKSSPGMPDIRNRLVNFKVCDVYLPDPREILVELYGNVILQGRVLDLTDSGAIRKAYAVVEVEGMGRQLIVPMERILGVL
jgi:hypothetical protein